MSGDEAAKLTAFCGFDGTKNYWEQNHIKTLPKKETWAPVILSVSSGLVLLFKPVNAAVNTVGYDIENPMSVRRNIVTTLAIIWIESSHSS